jgi:hypothetical protein
MDQIDFDKLLNILSNDKGKEIVEEVYMTLRNNKICLHDLGEFELINVINIIKDKIAIQELKIQKHNSIGLEQVLKDLLFLENNKIIQIVITDQNFGYAVFLKSHFGGLIGIYKKITQNIETDIIYQRNLLSLGYPNKNIYLFDKGKLLGNLFDLDIL